jgi:hypothetical protein
MGIKKLKSEHKFLNMTIADVLAKADPSKTKKYTQFLTRMLEDQCNKQLEESKYTKRIRNQVSPFDDLVNLNSIENLIARVLLVDCFFNERKMDDFISFCELMDKGVVEENDISKYDSWDMLDEEYFKAKNRDIFNKSKKDILKIYEDERYLVLKPLTYLASVAYGYQTKWCTTMVNDSSYFYSHSRGILIYVIDKIDNKKVAFHKSIPQPYEITDDSNGAIFNVWNAEDKRIDSFQSGLPYEILKIISMEMDTTIETNIPNYKLFSEEELKAMRNAGYLVEPDLELKEVIERDPAPIYGFRPRVLRMSDTPISVEDRSSDIIVDSTVSVNRSMSIQEIISNIINGTTEKLEDELP